MSARGDFDGAVSVDSAIGRLQLDGQFMCRAVASGGDSVAVHFVAAECPNWVVWAVLLEHVVAGKMERDGLNYRHRQKIRVEVGKVG